MLERRFDLPDIPTDRPVRVVTSPSSVRSPPAALVGHYAQSPLMQSSASATLRTGHRLHCGCT